MHFFAYAKQWCIPMSSTAQWAVIGFAGVRFHPRTGFGPSNGRSSQNGGSTDISHLAYSFQALLQAPLLTSAVAASSAEHAVARGGGQLAAPPSNSAPKARTEKRKIAVESSSKIIKKVLLSFFAKANIQVTRGH